MDLTFGSANFAVRDADLLTARRRPFLPHAGDRGRRVTQPVYLGVTVTAVASTWMLTATGAVVLVLLDAR